MWSQENPNLKEPIMKAERVGADVNLTQSADFL